MFILSRLTLALFLCITSISCLPLLAAPAIPNYFKITVVDEATGRGIPLVELKTTGDVRYYTDSNGIVAFYEPGLMGQSVFFSLKSHGYEFPADNFGYRGTALKVTEGGSVVLKMKRLNIAERLYRITGEGIYRDSLLTGQPVPIQQPTLNGQVMGQDTVEVAPYKGKLFWLWGDTNRPSYPLGNFATSAATSELPGNGGLDPSVGVNLTYFVDKDGFCKKMCPLPGPGPVWLDALMTAQDKQGAERLIARYVRIKNLGEAYEQGLAIFNDQTATFERLIPLDLHANLHPEAHPSRVVTEGKEYFYWGNPYPLGRVQADMAHITNPKSYEAFTCLVAGSRYDKTAPKLDRAPDGHLIWGWKADTDFITPQQQQDLIKASKMQADEALLQLRDVDTGAPVQAHAGSVFWNPYRKRWIMIGEQTGGTSLLGELWFAEADTPVGPWVYARKIITHDKYTFYNPTQHPYFDQEGGRLIYFEGTYTDFISGVTDITPRYNYNQIMYRLALDNPRLSLPVPVYEFKAQDGQWHYATREEIEAQHRWSQVQAAPFFAVSPTRLHEGLIPIYAVNEKTMAPGAIILQSASPTEIAREAKVLFYALPVDAKTANLGVTAPLYEYRDTNNGRRFYSTDSNLESATVKRTVQPLCRVWPNPMRMLVLDAQAKPVAH